MAFYRGALPSWCCPGAARPPRRQIADFDEAAPSFQDDHARSLDGVSHSMSTCARISVALSTRCISCVHTSFSNLTENVSIWRWNESEGRWQQEVVYRGDRPVAYSELNRTEDHLLLLELVGMGDVRGLLYSLASRQEWGGLHASHLDVWNSPQRRIGQIRGPFDARQHADGIVAHRLQDDEAYDARSDDDRPGRCPPARERHKGSSCDRHR
jgi:hypothetical protein